MTDASPSAAPEPPGGAEAASATRLPLVSRILLVFGLWGPLAVLWAALNVLTFGAPWGMSLVFGVNTMGWAAILSLPVWSLTARVPWPRGFRPGFYALHVVLGLAFAAAWILLPAVTVGVIRRTPLFELVQGIEGFFSWRMLTGFWLYGLIAGVGYAARIREALVEKERVAARAEALAVRAQLDNLRAWLRPHFLFNALHALSGLIHEDPGLADDALERISQLLRRSLAADGSRLIPLAEEWDFTSEYLELERLRLGDRLRVEPDLEPDALDCRVPAFVLQPLVENAVVHAVSPREEGGLIRVSARRAAAGVELVVRDDGTPPPPGALPEGHALDLLTRRLDALYGADASLTIEAGGAAGWTVVVRIPVAAA